jgi:aryl-alcohol dehydrogenase-like predicted oxidoreductase
MQQRTLGNTGKDVSIVGLGTWQLGADWGEVSESDARAILEASVESGVTFFDTADVYGDGRSEQLIGNFLRATGAAVTVATKMGRRVDQVPENYTLDSFRAWTDRSRRNLGVDTLDLVQLHCPPSATIDDDATYDALRRLIDAGAIAAYGVSVETCDQALSAIRHGAASVQIILNAFRLKPLDEVLPAAAKAGVGIIVRVPLASGLLSGRYGRDTVFARSDHRSFNRHGEAFDVGETFSGVDYATGVEAAQEFAQLVEELDTATEAEGAPTLTPAQAAIAWLWQQSGVSTVIPGARSADQARANAAAGSARVLGPTFERGVRRIYDERFRAALHEKW